MNNKETERADLHKTIWRIANDLRGSVDGIKKLNAEIGHVVARQTELRNQIDAIVADLEGERA